MATKIKNCTGCHRNYIGTDDEPVRYAEFCLDCLQTMNLFVGILQRREVEEDKNKAN